MKTECLVKRMRWLAPLTLLLLALTWQPAFAQNNRATTKKTIGTHTVAGRVLNAAGEPVSGASVVEKGSENGTSTNAEGQFSITVNKGATLIISNVGYQPYELKVGAAMAYNVQLLDAENMLDEVVVTGYQTISKDQATGSYGEISGAKLEQRPTRSILDKLDGMVAGLSYRNGAIEIRGENTLYASSAPLYVVDGFPLAGSIESINPEDVESIYVLKDAAATAQWGVRASNGVIVISTKKAAKNRTKVDFSSFYQMEERVDYSKMNWMTTAQEVAMDQEFAAKGWYNYSTMISAKNSLNQVNIGEAYRRGFSPDGNRWSEETYQQYINKLSQNDNAKQWEDYMLRSGRLLTNNLSVTTNTGRNSLYSSLVWTKNDPKEVGYGDNRIIFNLRDEFRVSDRFGFTASMNTLYEKGTRNGSSASQAGFNNAYDNLVDEYGNTIQYYTAYDPWTIRAKEATPGFFKYTYNPLDEIRANDRNFENVQLRAQFGLNWEIIPGLRFDSKYQYEKGFGRTDYFYNMDNPTHLINVNNLYLETTKKYQIPIGTRYDLGRTGFDGWNWRNTLTYNKKIGEHDFSVLTGFDFRKIFSESFSDRLYGYDKQTTKSVPVNNLDFQGGVIRTWNGVRYYDNFFSTANADDREIGFYVMPGYTWRGKYTLNGNYRVDQKNLFGSDPKFRYKPLWSVGGAWIISKEDFMQGVTWVDRLALKGSYGLTGNASNRYSPYAQAANGISSWGANLFNYLSLSQPANDKLKWEETRSLNLELGFGLFKSRLNGSLAFYNEKSTDLLGPRRLDPTTGFTTAVVNYASVKNNGVELTLNSDIVRTKDFNWNLGVNVSYNKNRVTALEDQLYSPASMAYYGDLVVGKPIDNMYSFNYGGVSSGGEVLLLDAEGKPKSWRDGVQDKDELLYHGTTTAPWYGGFQTMISWKGLDLSINGSFKAGHVFQFYMPYGYSGTSRRMDARWATRWQQPGDEANTRFPKIAYEGTNPYTGVGETRYDSYDGDLFFTYGQDWVYNASFMKIRDIILGYTLPTAISQKARMNTLRFTVQVTNPYMWVNNAENVDPENSSAKAWTNLKTLTVGLRASF